jgi:hypothetical protein
MLLGRRSWPADSSGLLLLLFIQGLVQQCSAEGLAASSSLQRCKLLLLLLLLLQGGQCC